MEIVDKKVIYLKILGNMLLIAGFGFFLVGFGPFIYDNALYYSKKYLGQYYVILGLGKDNSNSGPPTSLFSSLLGTKDISLQPFDTKFSLAIEKIGLTAPIIADVSVSNEKQYLEALRNGIAHAAVSNYPSRDPGNTYIFAHSSFDFWRFGKYARAFNMLHKLEEKDRIHIFYNDEVYVYEVINKEILPGWDIQPLDRKVVSPILTLQTCNPPGTTLNRLVVTSKLIDVKPYTLQTPAPDAVDTSVKSTTSTPVK